MKIKQLTLALIALGTVASAQADCIIYSQAMYHGYSNVLHNGTNLPQLFQDWNDKISSIRITDNSVLYGWEHANYKGRAYTYRQNTEVVTPQLDQENNLSSLKCSAVASAPSDELVIPPSRPESEQTQKKPRLLDRPIQIANRPPINNTPSSESKHDEQQPVDLGRPIFNRPIPKEIEQICKSGYVKRNAYNGDQVCVTPAIQAQTQQENQIAPTLTKPDGTCTIPIFVWRLAAPIDKTCASQAAHAQAIDDNNHAAERWR
jgi:hypothetical protein